MNIKLNSDDNLPLNKPLKFHLMTIIIRCVFSEDGKFYLQLFLDDILYELNINFLLYIKMSDNINVTYYQRNRDLILNKKYIYYYKSNKERLDKE